jgi:hypothetical protein
MTVTSTSIATRSAGPGVTSDENKVPTARGVDLNVRDHDANS